MKPTYAIKLSFLFLSLALFAPQVTTAQTVGINTTTPNGILEVNSPNLGVVLPRVALTRTNIAAPVLNPQGGSLVPGTVVYNTNTTTSGSRDVVPGIYVWTGSEWFNKFPKKESRIVKQTSMFQPQSTGGYQNIPGMTGQTFTPKFTGTYKIEVSVNYGGGYVRDLSPTSTDVAAQLGNFQFTFNGTNHIIPAKTNCVYSTSGTRYYAIWQQHSYFVYVNLTAGTNYSWRLRFDQLASPGFENNGDSGTGRGYIGIPDHVPCYVEFTYVRD
ncbi:hypothetical protein [uncultured Altibacter sp.]|uniref:hypothetical protein n=1 Tax=uncultured Altibacter sp. TaxID=2506933 RepID=UPI0030D76A76